VVPFSVLVEWDVKL